MRKSFIFSAVFAAATLVGCKDEEKEPVTADTETNMAAAGIDVENRVNNYAEVPLTTDLSVLSENERKMIPLLIEAAKITDDLFWYQAYRRKGHFDGQY